ncbi:uncharacterized protein ASCRUDRAFT_80194 [Ascoidea rubescens DSM 1968]|uniref:Myb-like domain-containing protein n=1 Tax=Ascoidea rubescens DSM 1968 TaxID=1344418 RepID=A0A1D2VJL7_9ASCO|nr:hypothetical protein ASCRUDRAFT_80194 [Ascoidea rubescens DSM 1968]ODV61802.1 hypothetical protein ASCRUDRAFT_80194 [Ascoidea rubescens DSM 1968]
MLSTRSTNPMPMYSTPSLTPSISTNNTNQNIQSDLFRKPTSNSIARISFPTNSKNLSSTFDPTNQNSNQNSNQSSNQNTIFNTPSKNNIAERLASLLPAPPLSFAQIRNEALQPQPSRRARRRSKYTAEQDELIVSLKKGGRSWVDIAELTGVGNFLAARNRYQVLIGQQGGGAAAWGTDDANALQALLDEGETEKWKFISREIQKATGKLFTDKQCQKIVRELFWKDSKTFGITEESVEQYYNEIKSRNGNSSNQNTHSATRHQSVQSQSQPQLQPQLQLQPQSHTHVQVQAQRLRQNVPPQMQISNSNNLNQNGYLSYFNDQSSNPNSNSNNPSNFSSFSTTTAGTTTSSTNNTDSFYSMPPPPHPQNLYSSTTSHYPYSNPAVSTASNSGGALLSTGFAFSNIDEQN